MYILGISAYYHDSAAALLKDGVIIVAIQEERLSRVKHDKSFPELAIDACLTISGITMHEIDHVVFYEKPFWKFERIIESISHVVPFSLLPFIYAVPLWIKKRLWTGFDIKAKLQLKGEVLYASHHQSHASASYYDSGFSSAAILILDGVGEYATTSISIGESGVIKLLKEQHFPHSLGLLYAAFTQYCGFKVNSGEYKLMGLAAYGRPVFKQLIYDHLVTQYPDGSYQLNMDYFNYLEGMSMINARFINLFGQEQRKEEAMMIPFYMDIAASIQSVIEELIVQLCRNIKALTQLTHLVCAGGVLLNGKLNQRIVESGIFEQYFFHPNPGDSGAAVGAAYLGYYDHLMNTPVKMDSVVFLGNCPIEDSGQNSIEQTLTVLQIPYRVLTDGVREIALALANGKIVAWMNGRMEFGPRALGNRSILADPRNATMKDILNEKVKLRESFRPFAPAILQEYASTYFELGKANYDTMMVTAKAKEGTQAIMPAAVHVDGTSRIQSVSKVANADFYDLILEFYLLTGCPALINTSFNLRGEPIAAGLNDALQTFLYTDIDILVLDKKYLISKTMNLEAIKINIKPKKITYD